MIIKIKKKEKKKTRQKTSSKQFKISPVFGLAGSHQEGCCAGCINTLERRQIDQGIMSNTVDVISERNIGQLVFALQGK